VAKKLKEMGMKLKRLRQLFSIPRSSFYYSGKPESDGFLKEKIREIAFAYPFYGYRRIHIELKKQGISVNLKKVYLLYRKMSLQRPKRIKAKKKAAISFPAVKASHPFEIWALDFFFTRLRSGIAIKVLAVIDEFTKFAFPPLVGYSTTGDDVADHLEALTKRYLLPSYIRSDNGPEFISKSLAQCLKKLRIKHIRIQKGKPFQNGVAESFIGKFRDECLAGYEYKNLKEAKSAIEQWFKFYNEERPHSANSFGVL